MVFPTPSTKRSLGMPQLCPLPITSGDPPLPSSAGGEALPAAQRVKSSFRHHLLPASTQQAVPRLTHSARAALCRQGRTQHPLGVYMLGRVSPDPTDQARAATAPCPPVRPGARLSRCSQHTQNTHIHCMYAYMHIETHQSLAIQISRLHGFSDRAGTPPVPPAAGLSHGVPLTDSHTPGSKATSPTFRLDGH